MDRWKTVLAEWISMRRTVMFLYPGISGIYVLICWLYGVPLAGAGYAFLLTAVLLAGYLIRDYEHFRKKHRQMEELLSQKHFLKENFPKADTLVEADYQKLAEKLCEQIHDLRSEAEKDQREMIDYYTMWVHQIKTPIAGMRLLLQQQELPEGRELEMELLRIEQYVQMVLSYLRLKDMSADLQIQTCDLDGIIRQAVRAHSRFFIGKRLRLVYEPVKEQVLTDEKWLEFVLEQLISNGVKYTQKQGTIKIYMEKPKVLAIEDTGIGIRKEDIPRVFERGFTGFNGREQKRATGLGLFLCKEICTKLSHKISIASEPGKGTRVTVDLNTMDLKIE